MFTALLVMFLLLAVVSIAVFSRVSVLGYGAFFFGPPLMGLISEGFSLSGAFLSVAVLMVIVGAVLVPALARASAAP